MNKLMPGELSQWANNHASVFGMLKSEEKQMIKLWQPIFVSMGYTLEELRYATQELARNPPVYRNEHLKSIHNIIGRLRKQADDEDRTAWDAIDSFEACKHCGNCGWVSVPNLRYVINGGWRIYPGTVYKPTFVVTCSCNAGKRIANTHTGKKQSMALEQYDERNPNWRQQLLDYHDALQATRKVERQTAELDRSFGKLVGGVAEKLSAGLPEQPTFAEAEAAARRSWVARELPQQLRLYDDDTEGAGRDDRVTEGLKS